MSLEQIIGIVIVAAGGLVMGSSAWPIKIMKDFKYEHWAFIQCLFGLCVFPWVMTLVFCPDAFEAYREVDTVLIIKSNLWSLAWGIANVLCGLCFVRIGLSLTGGILTGIGVSLGVSMPMIFKGTGLFQNAPDLISPVGITVLIGVAVMVSGVIFISLAGFGKDKILNKFEQKKGSFTVGFIMAVLAGVFSCGISFAFVYSQGPIMEAMKAQGTHEIFVNFGVWAVGLIGGASINVLYPAYLMTKNKSWSVLIRSYKEILLALIMAISFIVAIVLMGKGMLMLGALGASVGFGVQQAMQMTGTQVVGFISGEWRGVHGKPRNYVYLAIALLIIAAVIMAYGNSKT